MTWLVVWLCVCRNFPHFHLKQRMGQYWNSKTYKQPENKTTSRKWMAAIPRPAADKQWPNSSSPQHTNKNVSSMHQNVSFSQVIILTPLIKSASSFYNRATDSDKAAAVRILELLKFFSYILITACSQIIFQDRRERVRYTGKYSQV